jgi:hypothetical protein
VEVVAGEPPIDQLHTPDLDQAMPLTRVEPRRLCIQHDLAHVFDFSIDRINRISID